MSEVPDVIGDEGRLISYLLAMLPDDEMERLDEASIADDGFASRLLTTERDLIDRYVRNRLDALTRERLETLYASSALWCRKVEFAKRFLPVVDGAAAPVEAAPILTPGSAAVPIIPLWWSWRSLA